MEFRTQYTEREGKPYKSQLVCEDESRTKQCFRDECDINSILQKFNATGLLNHVNQFQGDYADLADADDYKTSMDKVLDAQYAFDSLPADLRKRFDNDPANFLAFVTDEEKRPELEEMGLVRKRVDMPPTMQEAADITPSEPSKPEPPPAE